MEYSSTSWTPQCGLHTVELYIQQEAVHSTSCAFSSTRATEEYYHNVHRLRSPYKHLLELRFIFTARATSGAPCRTQVTIGRMSPFPTSFGASRVGAGWRGTLTRWEGDAPLARGAIPRSRASFSEQRPKVTTCSLTEQRVP